MNEKNAWLTKRQPWGSDPDNVGNVLTNSCSLAIEISRRWEDGKQRIKDKGEIMKLSPLITQKTSHQRQHLSGSSIAHDAQLLVYLRCLSRKVGKCAFLPLPPHRSRFYCNLRLFQSVTELWNSYQGFSAYSLIICNFFYISFNYA